MTQRRPAVVVLAAGRGSRFRGTGHKLEQLLGDAQDMAALGQHFGADLYQAEVDYLCAREWAQTADDILWRRSKLGLRVDAEGRARLEAYLQTQPAAHANAQTHAVPA